MDPSCCAPLYGPWAPLCILGAIIIIVWLIGGLFLRPHRNVQIRHGMFTEPEQVYTEEQYMRLTYGDRAGHEQIEEFAPVGRRRVKVYEGAEL